MAEEAPVSLTWLMAPLTRLVQLIRDKIAYLRKFREIGYLHLENRTAIRPNAMPDIAGMTIADILQKEQIITELTASNRWEAIDELISKLVECGKVTPETREQIAAVVKKRETSMSTGIGFGIGIPHASTDLIYEVVGAFGRSTKGVNFDALDNQPVHLVMLFLVPQGQFQKHLHTLANIAKLLHNKDFRAALLA